MGCVGEELALGLPAPLHRGRGPAGEQHRRCQQQQKGAQGDGQVRKERPAQHGLLHGHIHEGDLLIGAVVLTQIPQAVACDGALALLLAQARAEDVLKDLRVLQVGIGAAGHVGHSVLGPDIDGEIGQQHPLLAPEDGDVRPFGVGKIAHAVVLDHLMEHLAADGLDAALDGVVHRQEDAQQHHGHQRHAQRHKFQPELADQRRHPLCGKAC